MTEPFIAPFTNSMNSPAVKDSNRSFSQGSHSKLKGLFPLSHFFIPLYEFPYFAKIFMETFFKFNADGKKQRKLNNRKLFSSKITVEIGL